MPPSMVSSIFLGKLMNKSISEVGIPLRQIQLSPDDRMTIRMMASRGALNYSIDLVFFTFTKLMPCQR